MKPSAPCSRGLNPRQLLFPLLSMLLALLACDPGGGELLPPQEDEKEWVVMTEEQVEASVEDGQRLPLEFLVQATQPPPPRETRTLEQARAAIETDPKLEPLREALIAGGWDEEQRAQMIYFAGTHQSHQPEDSIGHRHRQIHETFQAKLEQFERDLAQAEREQKVSVDRELLRRSGILTTLEEKEVIQ